MDTYYVYNTYVYNISNELTAASILSFALNIHFIVEMTGQHNQILLSYFMHTTILSHSLKLPFFAHFRFHNFFFLLSSFGFFFFASANGVINCIWWLCVCFVPLRLMQTVESITKHEGINSIHFFVWFDCVMALVVVVVAASTQHLYQNTYRVYVWCTSKKLNF